jgi:hypothetical protein
MSCLALTLPAATSCDRSGGILEVYVIPSSEVVIGALTGIAITNTGIGANTVTAIAAALDWRKINFDGDRDASAVSEQANAGINGFTHTITVNISSDETAIEEQLPLLTGCCGFVALVLHSTGRAFMYGLKYARSTGAAVAGNLKAQTNQTTGANAQDTEVGTALTLTSANMNYQRIPVALSAFNGITVV